MVDVVRAQTNHSHTPNRSTSDITRTVFFALLLLRVVNAFNIKTFFQPDEYFQSLEPAWQLAFGKNSGAWITWEWREHLRSSLHPILFAALYKAADQLAQLLQATPALRAEVLVVAPKLLQAGIAATGDFFTWRLACTLYGEKNRVSLAALALTALSPWQWFCAVRTLSNSLEVTLTIAALYFWPWQRFLYEDERRLRDNTGPDSTGSSTTAPQSLYVSLILAATACILRPTNIIIWATISICLLCRLGDVKKVSALAQCSFVCGSAVLALSVSMDRSFYGEWAFPPLKFLYFNVVQSLSVFYGKNRPDYYFTEGFPLLLTTALPFAAVGLWQAVRRRLDPSDNTGLVQHQMLSVLAITVTTTVVTMSLISHKEVRFIYPILPILHILAARPLAAFFHPFPVPEKKYRLALMLLMLALNIIIAAYVSTVHQRGVIDVMDFLRHEHEARTLALRPDASSFSNANMTVGFLMPCHSTPWRSHLVHSGIDAWALTCEPPLDIPAEERQDYQDEADVFYLDPRAWISTNMEYRNVDPRSVLEKPGHEHRRPWPQYLVFFEQLEPIVEEVLNELFYMGSGHKECWRGFNTHWHDDWRRQGDVVVYCILP